MAQASLGREQTALEELAPTVVPAPRTIALDSDGTHCGSPAHLMTHVPGRPAAGLDEIDLTALAEMLVAIQAVVPGEPFREFQSWAWDAKRVVPSWSTHPDSWATAFDLLATEPPPYAPTFLHRDFSHRNLLWQDGAISGVVDWVESSTGPSDLDAAHAATNLAVAFGTDAARRFLGAYATLTERPLAQYWLVMDAAGFLPPPGRDPMFGSRLELQQLDEWLHAILSDEVAGAG